MAISSGFLMVQSMPVSSSGDRRPVYNFPKNNLENRKFGIGNDLHGVESPLPISTRLKTQSAALKFGYAKDGFTSRLVGFLEHLPPFLLKPVARQYIAGATQWEMLEKLSRYQQQGILSTVDVLGESIQNLGQADVCVAEYKSVLDAFSKRGLNNRPISPNHLNANISLKLTALGLALDKEACYRRLRDLVAYAQKSNTFVRIDMENAPFTDATLEIYHRLRDEGFDNVGIVLQAYMKRTMDDARTVIARDAAEGRQSNFRLCKGIYQESPKLAYKDPAQINRNYAAVLEMMLTSGAYVGIATHDHALLKQARRIIADNQIPKSQYEFQMLLGVRPELRQSLLNEQEPLRVYMPYGEAWHAYSMRRLRENPFLVRHIAQGTFSAIIRKLSGRSLEPV